MIRLPARFPPAITAIAAIAAIAALAALSILSGCRMASQPGDREDPPALVMRFSDSPWMNVKLDSLVLESRSPRDTQTTTLAPFNPALQTVTHEITGVPGERYVLIFRFFKSGSMVAESRVEVTLDETGESQDVSARVTKLPAWDSLIPPVPEPGRLIFDPPVLDFSADTLQTLPLRIWNRNLDTLSWSALSPDGWIRIEPDTSLGLPPGEILEARVILDRARKPAARPSGQLLFTTSGGKDTLPLRYHPKLAAGQASFRGSVTRGDDTGLAGARLALYPPGDSSRSRAMVTDAAGEFAWVPAIPGRYVLDAEAAGHLRLRDTVSVQAEDTSARAFILLREPAGTAFAAGFGPTAHGPGAVAGGFWLAATQTLIGEGRIAFAAAGGGVVRTLSQGNFDSSGQGPFLVQEMIGDSSRLYLSYPGDFRIASISDWRGKPGHAMAGLPFQPFGMALDSNRLLVAGADSSDNSVLAVLDPGSLAVEKVIPLAGMRSRGLDLGIWGPKVAVGPGACFVAEGDREPGTSRLAKVDLSALSLVKTAVLQGGTANDVAVMGNRVHAVTLEAGKSRLWTLTLDLEPVSSIPLPFEGFRIHANSEGPYRGLILVTGRKGEMAWVDPGKAMAASVEVRTDQGFLLWDAGIGKWAKIE